MSDKTGPTLGDVISTATFAVAVITAWLYAVGWTYVSQYFIQFRIPLLMLDLPLQHYFVYGGLVLWKRAWLSLGIIITLVALAWGCVRWASTFGRFAISAIMVMIVLTLFWIGHSASVATARAEFLKQQQNDYPAYPRIAILLKKETSEALGDRLGDIAKTDCGRLLLFSSGRLFLIRPVAGVPSASLDVFVLPTDQLIAFRIVDEYRSCR
jgi:hypothetical protein